MREKLARSLAVAASARNGAPPWSEMASHERGEHYNAADEILADLSHQDVLLVPVHNLFRLRHEATKGTPGVTAATFNQMWANITAFARKQEL